MFNRARAKAFLAWAESTFGPCARSREERAMRFLEEAIELAHVEGVSSVVAAKIVARVYNRPPGTLEKEIGQCQATLETLALNAGVDPDEQAELEYQRAISLPTEYWRRRHDTKTAFGITTE